MARSGINRNAIRKLQRDLQKELNKAGPLQMPVSASGPNLDTTGTNSTAMKLDDATIKLLEWLFDNDGERNFYDFSPTLAESGVTNERAQSLVRRLNDAGYIEELRSFGGPLSGTLTSRGASLVEEIRSDRDSRSKRASDLRRRMLLWLFDQEDSDEQPQSWDPFVELGQAHLAGEPFTLAEVVRQATYLYERGLINAVSIEEESPGMSQPALTAAGNDCATHYNGDVSAYLRSSARGGGDVSNNFGPVFHSNVSGSQLAWGNQNSNQSQSATQNQQVAPGFEAIAEALAGMLGRIHELPLDADDRQDAEEATNEILAEIVEEAPDRGRFRRAAQRLKGVLAPILLQASTGAGEGAHELARQAIESLGNAPI